MTHTAPLSCPALLSSLPLSDWPSSTNDDKFFMGVMRNIALRCSKVHGQAHGGLQRARQWERQGGTERVRENESQRCHCHKHIQSSFHTPCAPSLPVGSLLIWQHQQGQSYSLSLSLSLLDSARHTLMIEMNSMSCLVLGKSQPPRPGGPRGEWRLPFSQPAKAAAAAAWLMVITHWTELDPLSSSTVDAALRIKCCRCVITFCAVSFAFAHYPLPTAHCLCPVSDPDPGPGPSFIVLLFCCVKIAWTNACPLVILAPFGRSLQKAWPVGECVGYTK